MYTMKQSFQYSTALLLLFLLFLIFSSKLSSTFLATKQGIQEEQPLKEITSKGSLEELESSESIDELMGLEDCGNGDDEECLKRRIIAEAHLDYIYTQHHKP